MKKIPILSIVCALFALNACDHYSERLAALDISSEDVANISPASGGDITFRQYLANEYYTLARFENDNMYDYQAAKYYTEKAESLTAGKMVSPASLNDFYIGDKDTTSLSAARSDLIYALKHYNIPENRYPLAIAQSRYDCWVEQTADYDAQSVCKKQFEDAMYSLTAYDPYSEEEFYEDIFDVFG